MDKRLITEELIERGKTGNGGWSAAQLACLGVAWPPLKGWKRRVIGTEISQEDADRFIALRKKSVDENTPDLFS